MKLQKVMTEIVQNDQKPEDSVWVREKGEEGGEFKMKNSEVAFKSEFDCLNNEGSKDGSFVVDNHLYWACNCHEWKVWV